MVRAHHKKKYIVIILITVLCLVVPVYSYSSELIGRINTVLPDNMYLDEVHIGGKTLIDIEKYIDEQVEDHLNTKIVVVSGEGLNIQRHEFNLEALGLMSNRNEIKESINAILNNDLGLIKKYQEYKEMQASGKDFNLVYTFNSEDFLKAIEVFDEKDLNNPINASYEYENGEIIIVGGEYGRALDKNLLLEEIENHYFNSNQTDFVLRTKSVEPDITVEELKEQGIKEKITSFTTTYNAHNAERTRNIRLATDKINGYILAPGETFSFNEVVGKRTKERGFQEAGIYVNGKLDTGIGGGICQVSTTLYNSVLLANLEIVERGNHSLTVPYVPLSRDAVINWGTKDLKFKNNTEHYIYIHSEARSNYVAFSLFSTNSNRRVELISNTISRAEPPIKYLEDDMLEEGKESVIDKGHIGYKSELIKKVYEGDELISTETVSIDRYGSSPKIIKIGTKKIDNIED